MLHQYLVAILLAPVSLCSSVFGWDPNARYATFFNSDDCTSAQDWTKIGSFQMNDDSCIRQEGKHSFWPGQIGTEAGNYCFVTYKPRRDDENEEGDCRCIDKARKINTKWKEEVECETKGVAGYVAYHFEKASIDGHCPVSGCYGPGGSDENVVREYIDVDT